MPPSEPILKKIVLCPSLGAINYQAIALIEELQRINSVEYPSEACHIRDLFLSIADYINDELSILYRTEKLDVIPRTSVKRRILSLGNVIQEMFSFIRYLRASIHHQTPPALQLSLSQLTNIYFPHKNGKPICLVRPQWRYNLTCVTLSWTLRNLLSTAELNPNEKIGETEMPDQLISKLWEKYRAKLSESEQQILPEDPYKQLAILSFPGLDTHDTLLYPLLAHELGHFIDYSFETPYNLQEEIINNTTIRIDEVEAILPSEIESEVLRYTEQLNTRIAVCVREILADLLATRMLGFAFFASHSEFLKTILASEWEPMITEEGYPGLKFRLSIILNYLLSDSNPNNLRRYFLNIPQKYSQDLLQFIQEWQQFLIVKKKSSRKDGHCSAETQLEIIAENIIENSIKYLVKAAEEIIPEEKCAKLSNHFIERISLLQHDLPPSIPEEHSNSFAEIMSAAWAYQILFGEKKENTIENIEQRHEEYQKICRLTLKAIELIPYLSQNTDRTQNSSDRINLEKPKHISNNKSGVLSKYQIEQRIALPINDHSRLSVIALDKKAVQEASLEVYLGNWFVVARRMRIGSLQPWRSEDERLLKTIGREEFFIPTGEKFLIHPGDLVLGVTREFFAFPDDVMAFVEGKSSLGRLGLIVATATQVAPGFHGVIVLELANTGTVPLEVVPGHSIAQLVLISMTDHLKKKDLYHRRYYCQIRP